MGRNSDSFLGQQAFRESSSEKQIHYDDKLSPQTDFEIMNDSTH
ncbi:hypothetical protein ACU8KH_04623 [Lachancea thermotolerans]